VQQGSGLHEHLQQQAWTKEQSAENRYSTSAIRTEFYQQRILSSAKIFQSGIWSGWAFTEYPASRKYMTVR
jgi:hypothetical protein